MKEFRESKIHNLLCQIIELSIADKDTAIILLNNLYQQRDDRDFSVDFILIRNFAGGLHEIGFKNILMAFMFYNIPSVNSLKSIFLREKPIIYGELLKIQQKLGKDKFPIVDQNFYPNIGSSDQIIIEPEVPCVVKIGTIDAGGKTQSINLTNFQLEKWELKNKEI